jgi:hypothetical protein
LPDEIEATVDWQSFVPTDTADHLATMDRAARESDCGVPWQLLAAIARVESDFGRNMATSSAGAIGYGQFLPSSWQSFGSDGNAYDYRDALPAIAQYLCEAGLEHDPRTALFAYNHADWYVNLVLDLAVRYDRIAPGAPIPDVLSVGPAPAEATKIQYAVGRDLRLQSRVRAVDGDVRWLGVPWRGRTAGQPIARRTLEATTLNMLRAAFGLKGDVSAGSIEPGSLVDAAWNAGLLAIPGSGPRWSAAQLRQHLRSGHPVVGLVDSRGLPGHPPDEDDGEQPLVFIGTTPDGFIYNDPTFSSSLGYGLELSEADLLKFWDAAASPRQALAFVARPKPLARQAHLAQAEAPEPIARVVPAPTPVPAASAIPIPTIAALTVATATPVEVPTLVPAVPVAEAVTQTPNVDWAIVVLSLTSATAAIGFRRLRGDRPR